MFAQIKVFTPRLTTRFDVPHGDGTTVHVNARRISACVALIRHVFEIDSTHARYSFDIDSTLIRQ